MRLCARTHAVRYHSGVFRRLYLLFLPLVTCACLGGAWWLWSPILGAFPFGPPRPPAPAQRLTPAAAKLYATTVPPLDLHHLPIADAIDSLRDGSGAQIFVNWRAPEASGVNKDTPVTLHTPPGHLATAVRIVLDQAQATR